MNAVFRPERNNNIVIGNFAVFLFNIGILKGKRFGTERGNLGKIRLLALFVARCFAIDLVALGLFAALPLQTDLFAVKNAFGELDVGYRVIAVYGVKLNRHNGGGNNFLIFFRRLVPVLIAGFSALVLKVIILYKIIREQGGHLYGAVNVCVLFVIKILSGIQPERAEIGVKIGNAEAAFGNKLLCKINLALPLRVLGNLRIDREKHLDLVLFAIIKQVVENINILLLRLGLLVCQHNLLLLIFKNAGKKAAVLRRAHGAVRLIGKVF